MSDSLLSKSRLKFHAALLDGILGINDKGVPTNADVGNKLSQRIARGIIELLKSGAGSERLPGQTSGNKFEEVCAQFLNDTFLELDGIRPGEWLIQKSSGSRLTIAQFEQYEHLEALDIASKADSKLAAALGNEYLIRPDVVVARYPVEDSEINRDQTIVDDKTALRSSLRKRNNQLPFLHASVSCKWTLRSDRAQNARSEGLNLMRNRKGRLPHFVAVTGEPMPSRIASLALGTGDVDCVYHIALNELQRVVTELEHEDAAEMLAIMVEGKRLRDISDLPLDLAV